jgi:membrane protein DedA with SNARE-associated domain
MEAFFTGWLEQASLPLLVAALVAAGLGAPFPEDIVLLLGGALAHRTGPPLPVVVAACACGVLTGDILLFTTARRLGNSALKRPMFRRLLTARRRASIEAMFARRGPAVVFIARHVAGLRAPTFAMAGIHGMPLRQFVFWDLLGMCISVPLMTGLGYTFADNLARVKEGLARVENWVLAAAAVGLVLYAIAVGIRRLFRRGSDVENGPPV